MPVVARQGWKYLKLKPPVYLQAIGDQVYS